MNGAAVHTVDPVSGRGAQMSTSPVADLVRGTQLFNSFGRWAQLFNSPVAGFGRGVWLFNSPVASPGDVRSPAFSSTRRVDYTTYSQTYLFTFGHPRQV